MMKMFVWSGLAGPDAPEHGVSFSAEDTWSPTNTSTKVFNLGFLKTDSDKAYEIAEKNGGREAHQKDPKQPVFFVLDWDAAEEPTGLARDLWQQPGGSEIADRGERLYRRIPASRKVGGEKLGQVVGLA